VRTVCKRERALSGSVGVGGLVLLLLGLSPVRRSVALRWLGHSDVMPMS